MDLSAGGTLSQSESGPYVPGGPVEPNWDVVPVDLRVDNTGGPGRDVAIIRPRRDAAPGYTC